MADLTLIEMARPPYDGTGLPPQFWPDATPPPPLFLYLDGTPDAGDAPVPPGIVLTVTATAPVPNDQVDVQSINVTQGGAWTSIGTPNGPPGALEWTLSVPSFGTADGDVVQFRAAVPGATTTILTYTRTAG